MKIRQAHPSDLNSILRLWEYARQTMLSAGNPQWEGLYPGEAEAEKDIANKDSYLLEIDGEAVGVMAVNELMPPEYRDIPWQTEEKAFTIHRLGIHPSLLRKGYARIMLLEAESIARQQGAKCIHIDTYSLNTAAQNLFQRLGYRQVVPFHMKQKPLHYIAFEKEL